MRPLHSRQLAAGVLLAVLGFVSAWAEEGSVTSVGRTLETHRWMRPADAFPASVGRWFDQLPPQLEYSEVRFHRGDESRWMQPGWDDRDWVESGLWDMPARSGIEWVRFRVRMGGGRLPLPAGIMVSTVRAYEIFWDGVLLGSSGVPGNDAAQEIPGRVDAWFTVPAALRGAGEHVVAIRTSSHRCGFPAATSGLRFLIDAPVVLHGKVLREAFIPTLAAGALCMAGLASLIMWLAAARRPTLLLLAGVCFSGAAMQTLQAVRWFFAYPADWHYPVLVFMAAVVGVQGMLTVAFVVVHFAVPWRRWLLGLLVPVFAGVAWLSPERANLEGLRIVAVSLAASLACAIWAVRRRKRGAWPAVSGLGVSAILFVLQAEDYRVSFFIRFLPALVGLLSSLAVQLHEERMRARAAQLSAARLEIELLKKNLQPHFLLNTLTALSEVVERDPAAATKLIEDLAEEFRTVSRVSAERLIPLAQELELCRAHLRVMSARTGRVWRLETEGAEEAAKVPPAVFLTLIENGFAHQRVASPTPTFRLAMERRPDGGITFTFVSPGEVQSGSPRPRGGTGIRYVQARLEESFPGRWTLAADAVAEGWRTRMEIAAGDGGAA